MIIGLLMAFLWVQNSSPSQAPQNHLAEAQRLRDQSQFTAAADLLRTELSQHPDNGDAARLLAETLYWMKDVAGAGAAYEAGMVRHPDDTTLRLQYARMLMDTGNRARARELLEPLVGVTAVGADAETLLGTMAYWEGDLTAARRYFSDALDVNPHQEEAARQLREIFVSTSPWLRISSTGRTDDQPIHTIGTTVEVGWFPGPLTTVTTRVQPVRYALDGESRIVETADVGVTRYTPSLRLETEFAGGAIRRTESSRPWGWTGRAAVGIRLPAHLAFRARAERIAYLSTASSLETPVMLRALTGLVHFGEVRGWVGEAVYQQQRYPDANKIHNAYGWLLAPVIHREKVGLQAGYSASRANADSSRFVLAKSDQPYAPTDSRFDTKGRYAPYYTPDHLRTHSVITAFRVEPIRGVTWRIGGAYALHASDNAPYFYAAPGQAIRGTYLRKFSPWNAHTSLQVKLSERLILEPSAEFGRSAFYSWATGGFDLTYRFTAESSHYRMHPR